MQLPHWEKWEILLTRVSEVSHVFNSLVSHGIGGSIVTSNS